MLDAAQHATFADRGLVRLQGLLSVGELGPAREEARVRLQRQGQATTPHAAVDALFAGPAITALVDALMGPEPRDHAIYRRPQLLATPPNAAAWSLPSGWHVDVPRLASGRSPGLQVFVLLDDVAPGGGGTVAIAGAHRLLNDRGFLTIRDVRKRLSAEPFFGDPLRPALSHVGDVRLELVEMAGAAGDVYAMDLRVLHSAAVNASERPRLMATHRYLRAAALHEIGGPWAGVRETSAQSSAAPVPSCPEGPPSPSP
jgi:ectoine hydroxylase-related dioxygenase (phytanoyl-CoA dioxygenase family)